MIITDKLVKKWNDSSVFGELSVLKLQGAKRVTQVIE
jgi:hypothetical protein